MLVYKTDRFFLMIMGRDGIMPGLCDGVRDWRDSLASHRAFTCRHVPGPREISAMNRSGIRIVRLLAFAGLTLLSARADAGMVLTAAGKAQGFALSTFATDFPNSGMNDVTDKIERPFTLIGRS